MFKNGKLGDVVSVLGQVETSADKEADTALERKATYLQNAAQHATNASTVRHGKNYYIATYYYE